MCEEIYENIKNAKKFTNKFEDKVTFCLEDSISFLRNFKKKIDFLYLDSLDVQYPNASEHQLNEIKNSIKILHKNSLILLDDKGGKTNLSKNYMLDNGLTIINETEQQILFSSWSMSVPIMHPKPEVKILSGCVRKVFLT